MAKKTAIDYIREKYADASQFDSACYDPKHPNCKIHLLNCMDKKKVQTL